MTEEKKPKTPEKSKRKTPEPRKKRDGWVPKEDCGVLLIPKPMLEAMKKKAHEKGLYLWQYSQQVIGKAVE